MHQLIHFSTDHDLRSGDAQYDQMQRSQILGKLAAPRQRNIARDFRKAVGCFGSASDD